MHKKLSLLIIITFLLAIIAPACDFMWGGKGTKLIEICTAKGIEQRLVPSKNGSNNSKKPTTSENCNFCFQNANFSAYVPPIAILEKIKLQSTKLRFTLYETVLLSRLSFDNTARGPPNFV